MRAALSSILRASRATGARGCGDYTRASLWPF